MKSSVALTAAVAALSLAALSPAAFADTKSISPLTCLPAKPSQAGDLSYTLDGVKNISAGARRINCPLPRDQEGIIHDEGPTEVSPWFLIGPSGTGSISCTIYHGSAAAGATTSSGSSGPRPANYLGVVYMTLDSTPAFWSQVQMSVSCNLGPGVTVMSIYFEEKGATQ